MTKNYKTWTAILALLPFLTMIMYALVMIFFMIKMMSPDSGEMAHPPVATIIGIISVAGLMGMATLAALIFFLIHVVNNKRLDHNERLMWILIIIFASMIAFPIYWYMSIYKADKIVTSNQDLSSHTFTR